MHDVVLRCYRDSDLRWLEEQAQSMGIEYRVLGTCITLRDPPPYVVDEAKARGVMEDTNGRSKT